MADLSDLQAAQTIKIAGASTSGVESTYADVSANQELKAVDILGVSVVQNTLSVGTGASVELKVGGSPLTNRKSIIIQAQGSNLTYGFSSGSQPFTIANGTTITLSLGPGISVWARRSSGIGSVNVAIAEFA